MNFSLYLNRPGLHSQYGRQWKRRVRKGEGVRQSTIPCNPPSCVVSEGGLLLLVQLDGVHLGRAKVLGAA